MGKTIRRIAKAIKHLIHRPIAARCHDDVKFSRHRFGGKTPRIAWRGGGFKNGLLRHLVEMPPEPPRLVATRGRIEDDANSHAQMISVREN